MNIEAMKLALEALEECRRDPRLKYEHPSYDKAITALRQAIEQVEKQEPVNILDAKEYADIRWDDADVPLGWLKHFVDALGKQQEERNFSKGNT